MVLKIVKFVFSRSTRISTNKYIYDFIKKDTDALEIPLKKKKNDYKKTYFHCCV